MHQYFILKTVNLGRGWGCKDKCEIINQPADYSVRTMRLMLVIHVYFSIRYLFYDVYRTDNTQLGFSVLLSQEVGIAVDSFCNAILVELAL